MPTTDREEALFAAVLEKPTRAERSAYLEGACGDDHALRARIEALLIAHEGSGGVLDAPPSAVSPTAAYCPLTEGPGTRVGPYKLLQQIGVGGMGVVYMAEQQEPVRRTVALKIIKPGMDSAQVIARFEAERQALAMMDHQNIARVLDANTTESGRPYFVMELVHGVPITQFCDANQLTPRERLELFVPVCQAIQHAHQKGIIHRDVKPSNVLVTMCDDKPVPKVIDFGVAKAIEQRLTEKTMFTQFGALVGTFEYMSPEQAEMNAFGVDTRSDIYSLGVLLYELLTGTTPLERKRLREAALDEMVRLIREEEPPRPSAKLSSSNNLPKIAAARKTEPERLSKLVRGEIDWIVMKCLEKNRSRRYDTASGLARDVERYLADEPVEACPPSVRYRFTKVVRKYKKALVTAAAFVVLLMAGAVTSALLAVWAWSAQREANRQRIASEEARQDADRQRIASDEAKRDALAAKSEADKQRDDARLTAYAAGINLAQRTWEVNDVARVRELLDEVPKEAAGRELRGFEWFYLSRLCRSETLSIKATGSVVAFSPDGKRQAGTTSSGAFTIWDSATGKELHSLEGHAGMVSGAAFGPDGRRLVTGSADRTVRIWNSDTGKELLTLKGHAGGIAGVAFTQDNQRVASVSLGSTPQSRVLSSGSGMTIKFWDGASGKELSSVDCSPALVTCVAFSPDRRRLATGSADDKVQVWDTVTGQELLSVKGPPGRLSSVVFSPDGLRLASVNKYGVLKVWDSASAKEQLSVEAHIGGGSSIAFSPDGRRLATGSPDRSVKFWDSTTGKALFALKGHDGAVMSLAFSPDGDRLASRGHRTLKVWDCAVGKELFPLKCRDGSEMGCLAFSPDGKRLAVGGHQKAFVWDAATGRELLSVTGLAVWVRSVAFSPDGKRLATTGGREKMVKIWDSTTGKELLSVKNAAGWFVNAAFSPDGKRLATGSSGTAVKIWDSATGKELLSFEIKGPGDRSVTFSPDGTRLATAGSGTAVKIWDSATGKELLSLPAKAGPSVAFSPDGTRLATWGNAENTVKLWDSATGKELLSLKGHLRHITTAAFTPDGKRLASGGWDGTVRIWDGVTGKELLTLKGHANLVNGVAFSPDGQRLACVGRGGAVSIWESVNVSAEVQQRRAANQRAVELWRQLPLRADVLERLRTAPGMSQVQREEGLAAARAFTDNPFNLNTLSWRLVQLPGRPVAEYRKAVLYSEQACQLEPSNGTYLNTLGVAYYRAGNHEKALETLLRSDALNKVQYRDSLPSDLAFLAMTQHRLGHAKEAQAYLEQLRERMKEPRRAKDAEAQGFLRETEALLAKPKPPAEQ
jgi:WD40 repeat protein/serine/threonine protein kinase